MSNVSHYHSVAKVDRSEAAKFTSTAFTQAQLNFKSLVGGH